jgi:hypothetical protein
LQISQAAAPESGAAASGVFGSQRESVGIPENRLHISISIQKGFSVMMKKLICLLLALTAVLAMAACGKAENTAATAPETTSAETTGEATEGATSETTEAAPVEAALPDGVYSAEFHTDSGMFHVNEACDGLGTLTVEGGKMTLHVSLASKSILNLFPGLAEDAQKEGAELLQPSTDTVTYSDGTSDEVYGFDIPVPALDTEFDLALIGKKGKWYDHKVSVTNPQPLQAN